ncbi:hypothetical protein ACOSQ2_022185 [Xanthoceras sorbifolium]
MHLSQKKYATDLLSKTNMLHSTACSTPVVIGNKLSLHDGDLFADPSLYRNTIDALQYLTLSRPDLSYIVNNLSQFLVAPSQLYWQVCKRVLRYTKGTVDFRLWFTPTPRLQLEGYVDADWASSVDDRRSTNGYYIFLGNNLLTWSFKKQHVVARSSTESEYQALAHATSELVWLQFVFSELGFPIAHCPILWCDNLGAKSLAQNPVFHARTKHIEIDVHFVRENLLNGQVEIRYIPTASQIADLLTKPLSVAQFEILLSKLTVALPQLCLRGNVRVNTSLALSQTSSAIH